MMARRYKYYSMVACASIIDSSLERAATWLRS